MARQSHLNTLRLESAVETGRLLRDGKLVAFPTETVFGLGADATNESSIRKLFAAKGRPADNPLIVHLPNVASWQLAARDLPESARVLLQHFAPGPLTVVVPKHNSILNSVTAGQPTVGIRIPNCPIARQVLLEAGVPIAAPSANRSGRPSCTTWQSTLEDLDGTIDAVLCKNTTRIGLESTVVDCCSPSPVLLRPGAIGIEELQAVVPSLSMYSASAEYSTTPSSRAERVESSAIGEADNRADSWDLVKDRQAKLGPAKSPGMRHPHYQPRAQVMLWDSTTTSAKELSVRLAAKHRIAICSISPPPPLESIALQSQYPNWETYARDFYEFLRRVDREDIKIVVCELAAGQGIAAALRDRQTRAADK